MLILGRFITYLTRGEPTTSDSGKKYYWFVSNDLEVDWLLFNEGKLCFKKMLIKDHRAK